MSTLINGVHHIAFNPTATGVDRDGKPLPIEVPYTDSEGRMLIFNRPPVVTVDGNPDSPSTRTKYRRQYANLLRYCLSSITGAYLLLARYRNKCDAKLTLEGNDYYLSYTEVKQAEAELGRIFVKNMDMLSRSSRPAKTVPVIMGVPMLEFLRYVIGQTKQSLGLVTCDETWSIKTIQQGGEFVYDDQPIYGRDGEQNHFLAEYVEPLLDSGLMKRDSVLTLFSRYNHTTNADVLREYDISTVVVDENIRTFFDNPGYVAPFTLGQAEDGEYIKTLATGSEDEVTPLQYSRLMAKRSFEIRKQRGLVSGDYVAPDEIYEGIEIIPASSMMTLVSAVTITAKQAQDYFESLDATGQFEALKSSLSEEYYLTADNIRAIMNDEQNISNITDAGAAITQASKTCQAISNKRPAKKTTKKSNTAKRAFV